ncbi:tyrosine-type recombinase/integrase [Loktanella agnita]|uniref:tyrosine-type recombinase/integrase n=1 Tax=Loktanella agnita TaxID=287097 RepID=UPI00398845E5
MATFQKLTSGRWQAQVSRAGVRKSKSFVSKREAKDWAGQQEYAILNTRPEGERVALGDAFRRYANEVSSMKRGERWEVIRLAKLRKEPFAEIIMSDLRAADFANWRDRRLREVSPGTVRREMQLVSGVINQATREWGYLTENPMASVRRPAEPPSRDRLPTERELEALAISAGADLSAATARAYHAFLFAIETGMRSGEIVGLRWDDVDLEARVAHLPITKNGSARNVPLSLEAVRLLEALPQSDPVFGLDGAQRDALWRKLRDRAGVVGLTFHDARHLAVTRLAKKLDVLDLARMVGHKNIQMLMRYYNASASDIARRLD